jgi:hypothetical protein
MAEDLNKTAIISRKQPSGNGKLVALSAAFLAVLGAAGYHDWKTNKANKAKDAEIAGLKDQVAEKDKAIKALSGENATCFNAAAPKSEPAPVASAPAAAAPAAAATLYVERATDCIYLLVPVQK